MKDKIRVEYLTVDGKMHTFDMPITHITEDVEQNDEVIYEIFKRTIKSFNWTSVEVFDHEV